MNVRVEQPRDVAAIREVIDRAFAGAVHKDGSEALVVDRLRADGALALSLVAEGEGRAVVGHAGFSPVVVTGAPRGWFGLAPVAVLPSHQRRGIGQRLIEQGLSHLRSCGAAGCVVLGEPAYYARFGFVSDPDLRFGDVPSAYFQSLCFDGASPAGRVVYHAAFHGNGVQHGQG